MTGHYPPSSCHLVTLSPCQKWGRRCTTSAAQLRCSARIAFFLVFGLIAAFFLRQPGYCRLDSRREFAAKCPRPRRQCIPPIQTADRLSQAGIAGGDDPIHRQQPQPQNVQVLTGMNTGQIAAYMVSHVAGGLKVDCTYCHNLANGNFADNSVPAKAKAREMMLMAADLNQNFISQLPQSVGGKQVTCATCHNGRPLVLNGAPNTGALSNYPPDQESDPR